MKSQWIDWIRFKWENNHFLIWQICRKNPLKMRQIENIMEICKNQAKYFLYFLQFSLEKQIQTNYALRNSPHSKKHPYAEFLLIFMEMCVCLIETKSHIFTPIFLVFHITSPTEQNIYLSSHSSTFYYISTCLINTRCQCFEYRDEKFWYVFPHSLISDSNQRNSNTLNLARRRWRWWCFWLPLLNVGEHMYSRKGK